MVQLNSVEPGCSLNMHPAWPHLGPGNKTKEARYGLFVSFPLDEVAAWHTTSKVVYPGGWVRDVQTISYNPTL